MVTEATWVEKAKATYELTKDKAVKIGGATLVGAGIFASTACGGGSEAAPAGVENVAAAEHIQTGGDASAEIVHGECRDRDDLYMRGTLAVVDESTGGLSEKYMADLENNMFFGDGSADSDSDIDIKPGAYTQSMLDQVRQGIRELTPKDGVPGIVYMLGEDDPSQDDYDGQVNSNVDGFCVDYN